MGTDRRKFLRQFGTGSAGLVLGNVLSPARAGAMAEAGYGPGGGPARPGDFMKPVYEELKLGDIRPDGWLLHQLEIMRDGTTGHLDEVYAKVRDDNGWLGGRGDGWEETPYWLDGATPLAYLLDDETLRRKVLRYIDWTMKHQRPSGYFGPVTGSEREGGAAISQTDPARGEDWWPKMVMLKVLRQYYSATADKRVIEFMTRYFHYQLQALQTCALGHWSEWATARGPENVLTVQWLYGITEDASLLRLAELIDRQAYPWNEWFHGRDWVIHAAAYQDSHHWMRRHGVNVAMALKTPVVSYQRTGDENYLKDLKTVFHDLMTLHGLPNGMFSADEDLHGNNPVQGVELCAIVETMFSLEQAIRVTGDMTYADALEKIAFNALPTQTTDDYNEKQYFQIANQVQVERGVFDFSLPFDRQMNNVFGMCSGYTCCLANMHQGWTKYAQQLFYATRDGGLAALLYGPSQTKAAVGGAGRTVHVTQQTAYPFEDTIRFRFSMPEPVRFPFYLRIPGWAKDAAVTLNGSPVTFSRTGSLALIDREWKDSDILALKLPMEVRVTEWGRNSRAVERGPLVYALKQPERWERAVDEKEGAYYSVYPEGEWNYGLTEAAVRDPEHHMKVSVPRSAGKDFIWNLSHAPVEITVPAKKIPAWKMANGVAPQPVNDRSGIFKGAVAAEEESITLIPYGCSKVRVVAFPVVP